MFDIWISHPSRFDGSVEFDDSTTARSPFNEGIDTPLNLLASSDILVDYCNGHFRHPFSRLRFVKCT